MSVNPQTGPSDYTDNIVNSIQAMDHMKNELLAQAQQKLEQDAAILETLPAQTAYSFSLAVLGQATQCLGLQQVGEPSEELNSQDATLNMCTYIQSLWNDLAGGVSAYQANGNKATTTQSEDAGNLVESLQNLAGLCHSSYSDPSSPDYGWMDPQTAETMYNSCEQILSAIEVNGSSGTQVADTILGWYSSYDSNPSGSTSSSQIDDCTSAMNTMINTMNQTSSVTTGLMKTGVSELQQYFGAIESSGQSQQQELNYFIQNEIPS
ncbi:MAG: hypothetical protein KF898_03160 [Parachlamydiales bacterium]|nr:hypothetical protein [Candidatus Acheromyda pituitae]